MSVLDNFLGMLERGQDSALLRFSIGGEYLKQEQFAAAAEHLAAAVKLDPAYSAAWKLYGKALAGAGRDAQAIDAYTQGIEVAEQKGDIQGAREMRVFMKRLRKST